MRRDTISIFNKLNESSYSDYYLENIKKLLPAKTDKTEFDGFKLEISGSYSYLNDFLPTNLNYKENLESKGYVDSYIAEMTPSNYLYYSVNYCTQNTMIPKANAIKNGPSDDMETFIKIDMLNKENSKSVNYAEKMKNGEKFSLPFLDFKNEIQDGNHRAAAAYINGYKTIPVLILY